MLVLTCRQMKVCSIITETEQTQGSIDGVVSRLELQRQLDYWLYRRSVGLPVEPRKIDFLQDLFENDDELFERSETQDGRIRNDNDLSYADMNYLLRDVIGVFDRIK